MDKVEISQYEQLCPSFRTAKTARKAPAVRSTLNQFHSWYATLPYLRLWYISVSGLSCTWMSFTSPSTSR